jgi:putative flippase GtrA
MGTTIDNLGFMNINKLINIREIISFAAVGTAGFVLDAAIVWALINYAAITPMPAKLMAFPFAVTLTWFLNRNNTFKDRKQSNYLKEWIKYIQVNSIGAITNNVSFIILVAKNDYLYQQPIIAVALGSIIGMIFNFLGSKFWVFNEK